MTWRCKCSFVFAVVVVAWLASCPLAVWAAEPPEISHVRVEMPFEGGADLDGIWEMLDMHYPRKWFNHVDFPNYCFWLEPGGYGVSARCSEIDDMVEAGLIEAYRQVGVWRIASDMGGSGGPQMRAAQKRVRTFAWPHHSGTGGKQAGIPR